MIPVSRMRVGEVIKLSGELSDTPAPTRRAADDTVLFYLCGSTPQRVHDTHFAVPDPLGPALSRGPVLWTSCGRLRIGVTKV
jgi:hypothetical protein